MSFKVKLKNIARLMLWKAQNALEGKQEVQRPQSAHMYHLKPGQEFFALAAADFKTWVDEAYKMNETINGALNLIANTATTAPLIVVDAKDEEKKLPDHRMQAVINKKTDKFPSSRIFMKQLIIHKYIGSIAFIEKVKRGNQIVELGLLRPDRVAILTNDIGIRGFKYHSGSKIINLEPEVLIPCRYLDPIDEFKGYSPLWSLALRADAENLSAKYVANTLNNKGSPGTHIMLPEGIDKSEKDRLSVEFDQKFSADNVGSTLVTDETVKVESFGFNFKDLDLSSLGNHGEAKILSTLQIPLQVYGSISGQQVTTRDNMKTAYKMFWQHCIIPLQTMIEDHLNGDIELTEGYTIKYKFDRSNIEALKDDQNEMSERAGKGWERDYWTLNEARIRDGLDPLPDGDKRRSELSLSMMPQLPEQPEEEEQEEDNEKKSEAKAEIIEVAAKVNPRDIEFKIASERFFLADSYQVDVAKMAEKNLNAQMKDVLEIVGPKSGKNLKQFEQDRINKEVEGKIDTWQVKLEKDSAEVFDPLTTRSAQTASVRIGHSFDLEAVEAKQAIKASSMKFAKQISEESVKQVKKAVTAAFDQGKTLGELSDDLRALGKGWSDVRTKMIARTETTRAANKGAEIAYLQAGVTHMRYSAVLDSVTSEICEHLDGKVVQVGEPFLTQAEGFITANGKALDLSYNDGVPLPPSHPNCRSTIIPVTETGEILFQG